MRSPDALARSVDAGVIAYAPRPHPLQRWRRRIYWSIAIAFFTGAVVLWGPRLWNNLVLLNLQRACFCAHAPIDEFVYRDEAGQQLVSKSWRDPQYAFVGSTEVWSCEPWKRFYARLSPPGGAPMATLFIGELQAVDGSSRLVVVEAASDYSGGILVKATAIEPGSLLRAAGIRDTQLAIVSSGRSAEVLGGQTDPNDPRAVTIVCRSLERTTDIRVSYRGLGANALKIESYSTSLKSPAPSSPATLPTSDR